MYVTIFQYRRASEDCSKRWGLLYLVNQFLKIYFKINKLNLCKPMIRAIESLQFKDKYPLSQLTTYKYYTGRKAMFDSEFKAGTLFFLKLPLSLQIRT